MLFERNSNRKISETLADKSSRVRVVPHEFNSFVTYKDECHLQK